MAREADYDVELFAEMMRSGGAPGARPERNIRGYKSRAPRSSDETSAAAPPKRPKKATSRAVRERKRAIR